MKSIRATRWTRDAIMAIGNIVVSDSDGGADADGAAGGAGQADSDKPKDDGAGSADSKDEDDVDPKILKQRLQNKVEEQERDFRKRKEAEKRADDLQKIVDEADRKGKTELENAKSDLEARDKIIAAKDDEIRRLTIENAFMTLTEIKWKNPATALRLVDLSDVEFDPETGKAKDPKQLLEAAKRLAKDEPYMVISKTDVDEGTPNGKPTGKPPAGGKPVNADDAALRKKYRIHT